HAERLKVKSETYGPQLRARLAQAAAIPAHAYIRAQQIRQIALTRLLDTVFDRVDLLVLPTLMGPPPPDPDTNVGGGSGLNDVIAGMTRLTRPASFLGLPALSLPAVWTDAGPLSLQIVGRHWQEAQVAALAERLESIFAARPQTQPMAAAE
ncbi:MAG: amidase family protein, partial [Pseudomonadota bacterium]